MPSKAEVINIICLPPATLGMFWKAIGPLLLKSILAREKDIDFAENDLKAAVDRILDGRFNLWVVLSEHPKGVKAAFLTSLIEDHGSRYVHIHTMAGEDSWEWGPLIPTIMDAYAKAESCRGIRYEGSKAWTRFLPARSLGTNSDGVETFERSLLQ